MTKMVEVEPKKVKRRCFVISPIGEEGSIERLHADMVLGYIIKPALPEYEVTRADAFGAPEIITTKIIEAITTYDLSVADLTFHNPNVFYELGLRHMSEKPVIHIAGEGTRLPFDNAGVSTIFFQVSDINSHTRARNKITESARLVEAESYKVSNPVTQARGSIRLAKSGDANEVILAGLTDRIASLESKAQDVLQWRGSIHDTWRAGRSQVVPPIGPIGSSVLSLTMAELLKTARQPVAQAGDGRRDEDA